MPRPLTKPPGRAIIFSQRGAGLQALRCYWSYNCHTQITRQKVSTENMFGAVVGDIVGSRFEFNNIKTKDFELFHRDCSFTDDSILTIAVAQSILAARGDPETLADITVLSMRTLGRRYPDQSWGAMFSLWLFSENPEPYNSFGNGAAMRVSPCGMAAKTIEEARFLSREVTRVTHSHP